MSLWNTAHPWLRELVSYEPGKPIEDVARELGLQPHEIIKLASNENPLGPSPKALAAMREMLERAHFYPDGGGYYLREAIAKKFGFERGHVMLGCGSNEIIEFIGKAFLNPGDEIVTARHAFVVYKLMATLFGATTVEVDDPNFAHDLDAMAAAITPRTKEVFIANPNNPTGTLLAQDEIDRFMERVPEHVIVVFDEAYHEFLEDPPDTLKFVREGMLKVRAHNYDVIVLAENFNGSDLYSNPILAATLATPPEQRRLQYITVVGPSLATADEMQAFVHSVDLVVGLADVGNLRPVLRRGLLRMQEFYASFREVQKAEGVA